MTTHSETAVVELGASELGAVQCASGHTTVDALPDAVQNVVRKFPDALLARRIIVTEGKTEAGLCRALDGHWTEHRGIPPAEVGVAVVPGGGHEAPALALKLAQLGYQTALLADSDVPLSPDATALEASGVKVVQWAEGVCLERRVLRDLPWADVVDLLAHTAAARSPQSPEAVYKLVAAALELPELRTVEEWLAADRSEVEIREAIATVAVPGDDKAKSWFKRIDLGEALGSAVVTALPAIESTDLALKLADLEEWAYAR